MRSRRRLVLLAITLLVFTVMCTCPNLDTEYFTRNKPRQTDLVGKYVPITDTLQFIRNEGGYETAGVSIILSQDGSFEMTNMPDCWRDPFGKSNGGFDSGRGKWQVVKHQEWWELELDLDSSEGFPKGLTTSVPLVGEALPYRLWFYVGDPDGGDVMIFEQVISK